MKSFVAATIVLVATAAFAQVRDSVTVQVVEVPVHVTSNGEPVTGLTRENFELSINGRRQKIDYFDVIDFAALSPEQQRDPRQRRLYTLVFDISSTPNQLHRAQHAALKLLDDAEDNYTFAVASLGYGPLKMVVPFTRDRVALRHAIRSLKVSLAGDPLHLGLTTTERGGELGRPQTVENPVFDVRVGDLPVEYEGIVSQTISELGELAFRLSGMEGYKHVVFLSPGFDSTILHGVPIARARNPITIGPGGMASSQERGTIGSPNARLLTEMRYLAEKYAKSGVFLDAIDTAGLRPLQTLADNESLSAITHDTGGTLIEHHNDLTTAMQALIDRQRVVYVLGFVPPTTNRDTNRIGVKLVNAPRGSHLAYRPSYSTVVDPYDSADRLRLADIVTSDIPQNGVTTTASVEAVPGGATIEATIPGPEMLAHAISGYVGAEAMLYVFNGPTVVTFTTKKLNIDVQRAEAGLASGAPVRVREKFDLPPGKYAAKVLVRIDGTGELGFARTDFEVQNQP